MSSSRACVFINSNDSRGNKLINTISCIKPPFPPNIDLRELIMKQNLVDKSSGRSPNAFIIYRKAYVDAARKDGYQLPMTVVSSMASSSWGHEPQRVKDEYKRLATEANSIRNKLIPRNKRKRQKWNIVSFPPPPPKTPPTKIKASTATVNDKTKPLTKKKKVEISTTTNFMPTFHIPYDICSKIEDRYNKPDDSGDKTTIPTIENTTSTNHDFNFNEFENFNIPQIDIPIIEAIDPIDINNEFDSFDSFLFFNEHEICYPSFWSDYY